MLIIVMINRIYTTIATTISADSQPEPVPESHDPTATSEKQPQPTNNSNDQLDVPTS